MIETRFELTLLLPLAWPLLLVAGLMFDTTRALMLKLVPWSALPILIMAAILTTENLQLPFIMLGSGLEFDATARVFVLLNAGLWLATGLLARPRLHAAGAERFAVLLLLAMTGSFGLALASDAVLFFAASTLTGYALYAMLAFDSDASAQQANRVLLVLLVVSDLLVFELILLLGHAAGSVDFASLRQALLGTDSRGLVLTLLLFGFGIKTGVLGVHFWVSPVFVSAGAELRPAIIAFMLSAGLLGWLRLLLPGEGDLLDVNNGLQWLAWATLLYILLQGVLAVHSRALFALAAIALSCLWLVFLAVLHPSVQDTSALVDAMYTAVLQTGFAFPALLLLDRCGVMPATVVGRLVLPGMRWLAVILLAAVPAGVAVTVYEIDATAGLQLGGVAAVTVFLAVRGVLLIPGSNHTDRGIYPSAQLQAVTQSYLAGQALVATLLTLVALLVAASNLSLSAVAGLWRPGLMMIVAGFAAWLSVAHFVLPASLTQGALLARAGGVTARLIASVQVLANMRLPYYRDSILAQLQVFNAQFNWQKIIGSVESTLARWSTALIILTLLGLVTAGLSLLL